MMFITNDIHTSLLCQGLKLQPLKFEIYLRPRGIRNK